ncbi:MAG TPA: HAMP domain-containing sensor histidine kinase [Pusillimonas sp.]|uniref:HAMP domain-containing sensor histidine kinase n=1 Tax=Pusillimonas sp. TaxID=3040095 RepID=UPI002CE81825|nr:HAMP domain-containing sensor histidine kinase [Pusillimonas sp.]HUH86674.1 HAMP domain-containing sensor histidine kinase [Pusillimonas sp.]
MKLASISRRVYRAILAVSVATTLAMVMTVLLVNEDLEHTLLDAQFAQERDFILMNHAKDETFIWDTPDLAVAFVPKNEPRPILLPKVFQGLTSNYSAEINRDGDTYLVRIDEVENGVLYLAKSITHFEQREALFSIALVVMALTIFALSLLLAVLSSRRIVKPLKLLSERISSVPVGPNMPRLKLDYNDAELHSIALTFNRFLDELEAYVRREQTLLSLAGHELRTPIAVMSGALDIIESRGQLNEKDKATLLRARKSCDEMTNNVNILLKLARRDPGKPTQVLIDVAEVAQKVVEDLRVSHNAGDRVKLSALGPLIVQADAAMLSMLLRNLIQNAVQHTRHEVRVTISDGFVDVEDQGGGLKADEQAILMGRQRIASDDRFVSGLGLYVVTLMAERLGWRLDVSQTDQNGTRIRITPPPSCLPSA